MKKIILTLSLFIFSISFAAPTPPVNGGTGISNANSNTITVSTPVAISGSTSSAFSIDNSTKGSRPYPVKTQTQGDAIPSPEAGLEYYNSNTQTLDYYDGADWQKILTPQNVEAGSNVTVTNNGDGKVTISSSGGGTLPAPAYGAYSVHNNIANRPASASFVAVPVSSGFTSDQEACFTNSVQAVAGVNTPVAVYTCSQTQFFEVDQSVSLISNGTPFRQYTYAIAIKRAGGSIETTNYQIPVTQDNDPADMHPASMHGVVQLAQGDGVFTQVQGGTDQTAPTNFITSKVATIAGTSQPSFQDVYNEDPGYPNPEVDLATGGTLQFNYGSEIPFGVGSNGIASTLGLRVLPSNGVEAIELIQTDDAGAFIEAVSTLHGAKIYPDMTTAQRGAIIGTKPIGMGIYNSQKNTLEFWTTDNTWMTVLNSQYNQTINGVNTFTSNIVGNLTGNADSATIASSANSITTQQASTNALFYPLFVPSSSNSYQLPRLSLGFTFNAFTNNLTATTFTGNLVGNASTAGVLQTARAINGVNFDGSAPITITAAPSGSAGGDLSSTYPNPTVAKINGATLGTTTATAGNILVASAGNAWTSVPVSGNVLIDSTGATTIGATQVTNAMLAGSIDLTSKVTNDLPFAHGGFGFHTATTGDLFLATGTNTPGTLTDVAIGRVLVSGGVGGVPSWSNSPTLTGGLTLPSPNSLIFSPIVGAALTISSATGAANTADVQLNRFDVTNGNNRVIYRTGGTNDWSVGERSTSANYVVFDETSVIPQLTMAKGTGTTGTSTFAGQVTINGLGGVNSLVATNASKQLTTTVSGISPTFAALTLATGDLTMSSGGIILSTAGKTVTIKSGANSCAGTFTLASGAATVTSTCILVGDIITQMKTSNGGTPGTSDLIFTVSAGSFTVAGGALDNSVYSWYATHIN